MMVRLLITIGLFLSLIILARGMIVTFDTSPLKGIEKHQKQKRSRVATVVKQIRFYPPPPPVLPDLNSNYVFNEERTIAGKLPEEGAAGQQDMAVNIKDVFYVGSVITGESRKGIVSFPVSKTPAPVRPRGRRVTTAAPTESAMEQVFLVPGDSLGGYTVTEVEADRIVFKRGAEVIEKLLNDPDKKRKIASPQPLRANSSSKVTTISPTAPTTSSPATRVRRPTTPNQRLPRTRAATQRRQPTTQTRRTPRAVRMTEDQIRQMEQDIDRAERQRR